MRLGSPKRIEAQTANGQRRASLWIPRRIHITWQGSGRLTQRGFCILWFLFFSLIALGLQHRLGAYHAGFGSHPDEPAHYVTGLMVYKYCTTALGTSPMAFAERFYVHYPAVAFGHWPPLFYILQACWGIVFGLSRSSVLMLIACTAGLISTVLYYTIGRQFGRLYGFAFAAIFLVLPIVQQHISSIMAEVPLTLFTFLTALALASASSATTATGAVRFGVCLCATISTKGNGWALIPLPFMMPLFTRCSSLLRRRDIWISTLCVLGICFPMTWATMHMTTDGWAQQSPSMSFFSIALPKLLSFHLTMVGWILFVLTCVGIHITVVRPLLAGDRVEPLWTSNATVVLCVLLFHAIVPTSLEPRKVFMSIPSLLLFAAAGLRSIERLLRRSVVPWRLGAAFPLCVAALIAPGDLAQPHASLHANMGNVAQYILDRKELDRSAILVATTEVDERAELSLVAEMAERENGNYRNAVIRAGKFIADSSWLGSDYKLKYSDAVSANTALQEIPIAAIVLYTHAGPSSAHAALIRQVVTANKGEWLCTYTERTGQGSVELWTLASQPLKSVRLPEIDLRRKLGRTISADF